MKIISIFNNKGGVGKTTYMYHIAHLLAQKGKTVLMVDLDSQCNLSAYALTDSELEKSWKPERGNSVWLAVEPVAKGVGDVRQRTPRTFNSDYPNLYITPGDVMLSGFEDNLGESWTRAIGGDERAIRVQSAVYRYLLWASEKIFADIVMVDLGPNLGALNRCILGASDYFIVPMSPDLFSIRGTENLGKKLVNWRKEWTQCITAWDGEDLAIPKGSPIFLGYVTQQHNIRNSPTGMTKGWSIYGKQVESAVKSNIVAKLEMIGQVHKWQADSWQLGTIPNLHSLIPYSLNAKKPVFDCSSSDGLNGSHITKARESRHLFTPIVNKLLEVV